MNKWIISCSTAANLTGKAHNSSLNWSERIQLTYHSRMCEICRRYKKQQDWIHKVLKTKSDTDIDNEQVDSLEVKILDKLKNQ